MYPSFYYAPAYFAARYFERAPSGPGGGYFAWLPLTYFCPAFWPSGKFSDTAIGSVLVAQDGSDLHVSWTAAAPAGTSFQAYVNRVLMWHGTATQTTIPIPDGMASISVVIVPSRYELTSFGAYLPTSPGTGDRARLDFLGGTYLAADIDSFKIFGSSPGGAVSYAAPLATLAAYPGGAPQDGFGLGPFGAGGFGLAASSYTWTSGRLSKGTYSYSVQTTDIAGNASGPASPVTITIASPPLPPAPNAGGNRLSYSFNASTRVATLRWLPSPV